MKKLISFFSFISISLLLIAQNFSITENQPVIIYSLPMTQLCIEVQMEKITQTPGIFYIYSERYLATKNVITEEKTTYSIKNITVYTQAIPDLQRTYSFVPSKNSPLKNITLNQQGILCGINVACQTMTDKKRPVVTSTIKEEKKSSYLLPLGEEYLLAGSTAKLAEGAAKQIYDIRDSQLNILTCDVDHLPADGASLNTLLRELNAREKELTELFIGKTTTESLSQVVYLTPAKTMKNEILFRFSTLKGVVPSDDLSGIPYYITISPTTFPVTPATKEKKQKTINKQQKLNTILPASTLVNIGDGKNIYFSQQFLIPQFGVVVPLPNEVLQNPKTKIYIDPQTGRLLKVE